MHDFMAVLSKHFCLLSTSFITIIIITVFTTLEVNAVIPEAGQVKS